MPQDCDLTSAPDLFWLSQHSLAPTKNSFRTQLPCRPGLGQSIAFHLTLAGHRSGRFSIMSGPSARLGQPPGSDKQ